MGSRNSSSKRPSSRTRSVKKSSTAKNSAPRRRRRAGPRNKSEGAPGAPRRRDIEPLPADGDERPPAFSDDDMADRFSASHRNVRYTAEWDTWHEWDGKRWLKDRTLDIFDKVRMQNRQIAAKLDDDGTRKRLSNSKTIASIASLARSDKRHAMLPEEWDSNDYLLGTPDGIVDLKTGFTSRPRMEDYITKSTTVASAGECPTWQKFLDDVTDGNKELQDYLQRVAGYCLTGDVSEHAIFFLYGEGGNGKSTFLETLREVYGDYARPAPMSLLTTAQGERHPTEIAGLRAIRLAITTEIDEGKKWDTAKIKSLTGGDQITARLMRQDFFDFDPKFKLMIAGNHKPKIGKIDDGIRRRLQMIPFTVKFPNPDQHLREKLRKEHAGILRWAIEGARKWQQEGLNPPEIVQAATKQYFEEQDRVSAWMKEQCILNPHAVTSVGDLYAAYKKWADEIGEQPVSNKAFSETLNRYPEITDDRVGHNRTRVMRGIKLLEATPVRDELVESQSSPGNSSSSTEDSGRGQMRTDIPIYDVYGTETNENNTHT
jgi:putative DNA primase/helicase